eukprot:TRINITY_DN10715_c0_g1_i1.p1 TRINITY_DN10715_c0_g1~~TRINITY_DN10715_c0_g1_i1.p1  ORF type:complete len:493 (-),score=101.95 TRINITY_DN10715_c0_g1_i1:246-1661(-)
MAFEAENCPVCLQRYRDPQLLSSCGHSFCKQCIEAMRPCNCPLCRTPFKKTDIRPNYALMRMMQEHEMQPQASAGAPTAPTVPLIQAQSDQALAGLLAQQPAVTRTRTQLSALELASNLNRADVPFGLAQLLGEEDHYVGMRIFLLDNSGSTQAYDGKYLEEARGGGGRMVPCTRWQEIQRMAMKQAEWNAAMGTPCEFILLNPPAQRGFAAFKDNVDLVRINPAEGDTATQLGNLKAMLDRTAPRGATPLCERIKEIHHRLAHTYGHFAEQGLRAILVIATDGLPTTPGYPPDDRAKADVISAMREITRQQPVFLVVRLCTDEDDVVEYYNKVDEEEELPLEVIDDIESEAKEVAAQGNGWLTYSPTIHMIREGGTFLKLLDLLDERPLNPLEARLLAGHMLQSQDETPLQLAAPRDFVQKASERLSRTAKVYNPLTRGPAPLIDIRRLRRALDPPRGVIGRICRWLCQR